MSNLAIFLQALVASSIFFVWVVRYTNIVEEFTQYRLPAWLRDLVGILKLTAALLLILGIGRPPLAITGAAMITLLMGAAVATHLRMRNPLPKMLPSTSLLILALVIGWLNYQLQTS